MGKPNAASIPHSAHRRALVLLPFSLALPLGASASADRPGEWPTRPVQITVVYPPGGISDQIARALAELMKRQLGMAVVVDNRAGASGTIALELLSKRNPDGHSLCFAAATAAALLARAASKRSTPSRTPVPVAGVMRTPILVVGTRSLRAGSFGQMIDAARERPGSIRWATTGEGTTGHAVLSRVSQMSGAEIVHIPYKGGGQQIADALAGHFEVLSTNVAAAQLEDIASGRLVALAVGAPERLDVLPHVPTLAELGYPDANLDSLFGLFAPAGVSSELVQKMHRAVATALAHPSLRDKLLQMNNIPFDGSAADFARLVAREALFR